MDELSGVVGIVVLFVGFALGIAILLAQLRLFSIDKTLKGILAELKKGAQPEGPPAPETEADLERRRAAMKEAQENWPTYK